MAEKQYFYGTGRRKTSSAQVRLYVNGEKGAFVVNGRPLEEYFDRRRDLTAAVEPLRLLGMEERFRVSVKVRGGGRTGQAEAVRHGIARALVESDPELKPRLKQAGLLTRDPRMKERKKPGLVGARRAKQYTKR